MPGAGEGRDGSGRDDDGDEGRELLRQVARLESDSVAFRSMTSLDIGEARDLYRQAESLAAARAAQGGGAGRRRGGGNGGDDADAAFEFMPFGKFLMALMQARKTDELLVGHVFRVDPGTALAAFEEALPFLLEIRDMPRRFARRLVPFGYKLDAKPNKGKGSGSMLDYME